MGIVATIPHVQIALRVLAILMGVPPIAHTEWNKWQLKRLKKGIGAAANDELAKFLADRRSVEATEYKWWKVVLIILGTVCVLLSYILPLLFP